MPAVAIAAYMRRPGDASSSPLNITPVSLDDLGNPTIDDATAATPGIELAQPSILQSVSDTLSAMVNKVSSWSLPARAAPYAGAIADAEQTYGLPSGLLARQLYQESAYRPEIINGSVTSSAGAVGIAQFMPATAASLGIDPTDPFQSIDGAARYMRSLFDQLGSWLAALAAYNWGIGNVQRKGIAAAPAETQRYVSSILSDVNVG